MQARRRGPGRHSDAMTEDPGYSQDPAEPNRSEADDWLAGATIEAQAQDISLGPLDVGLEGLDLPDPSDDNVA